jgi:phage protein U|tara:strand:- start:416 stop:583 length:168 start_codon:yes stop_codon:yes gene_type:complete
MMSEIEQKEFAMILEFQAMKENTVWLIEGEGETLDGMKVVKAMIENKKVYSVPKK